MKWVKKGGMIRCCDDNTADKLLQNGFEVFEPVKPKQPEEHKQPEEPKEKAAKGK